MMMRFEWDEDKNRENIAKHGIDFRDVWEMFAGPMLIVLDDRKDYGEERWIGVGFLGMARVAAAVYNEVDGEMVRVISVRKATTHERSQFEQYLAQRLEES